MLFGKTPSFNFMGGRRIAVVCSALLIVLSFGSIFSRGLNFGIDFTGGVLIEVAYAGEADLAGIRDVLIEAGFETPLVQNFPDLNVVATTEQVPGVAVSASPALDATVRDAVRAALLEASKSERGRSMLQQVNLAGFEPATADTYDGYARLLEGTWGY